MNMGVIAHFAIQIGKYMVVSIIKEIVNWLQCVATSYSHVGFAMTKLAITQSIGNFANVFRSDFLKF